MKCTLLYEGDKDVSDKLTIFMQIMLIISQVTKSLPNTRSKPNCWYKTH